MNKIFAPPLGKRFFLWLIGLSIATAGMITYTTAVQALLNPLALTCLTFLVGLLLWAILEAFGESTPVPWEDVRPFEPHISDPFTSSIMETHILRSEIGVPSSNRVIAQILCDGIAGKLLLNHHADPSNPLADMHKYISAPLKQYLDEALTQECEKKLTKTALNRFLKEIETL